MLELAQLFASLDQESPDRSVYEFHQLVDIHVAHIGSPIKQCLNRSNLAVQHTLARVIWDHLKAVMYIDLRELLGYVLANGTGMGEFDELAILGDIARSSIPNGTGYDLLVVIQIIMNALSYQVGLFLEWNHAKVFEDLC